MTEHHSPLTKILGNYKFAALASLSLGLAPFSPEPHIWGKIKWIAGGARGMKGMDYFDVVLHGLPWLWLVIALLLTLRSKFKS